MFYATQARENRPYYYHETVGYNYRMSNICAGIGRGQMEVLQDHVERRREINQLYKCLLTDIPSVEIFSAPSQEYNSNYWLTCLLIDEKTTKRTPTDIMKHLEVANIESRLLWRPMHMQPVFASALFYGDGTSEAIFNQGLCLPSGSLLSDSDIARVAYEIKMILA